MGVQQAFLTANGYQYDAAFVVESPVTTAYQNLCPQFGEDPGWIPLNFIIDRDGYARHCQNTVSNEAAYEAMIRELLGENFE